MKLTTNQSNVLIFLKSKCILGNYLFVSPIDIGYIAGGYWRDSSWASPICKALVKKGLIERSNIGHYRFKE